MQTGDLRATDIKALSYFALEDHFNAVDFVNLGAVRLRTVLVTEHRKIPFARPKRPFHLLRCRPG